MATGIISITSDHLGNVRSVASNSNAVLQSTDYFPFRLAHSTTTTGLTKNKYYNGKELQTELGYNLYDYRARMYDPSKGIFGQVDPMTEKYFGLSPYVYCSNNPINRTDPDGKADFVLNGNIISNDGVDDGRKLDGVNGAGLSRNELKATKRFIKQNSGNSEAFQNNEIAYTNSIEIESSNVNRQAMVNEVSRDNGRGGTSDDNNREYGGSIQNGNAVLATPGAIANPAIDPNASITLPFGHSTFHSHPSGNVVEQVAGGTRTSSFIQSPSSTDIENAGTRTHYVFGRGDKKVYVYTSDGVQAVIPMRKFVNLNR